jgi:acetyl-CoA C-acetyltransferase
MFRKAIKPETYAAADMVSEPLNMFDIAPNADGAAAVLLTRSDLLPGAPRPTVAIVGSGAASDTLALHDRKDILYFETAHLSAGKAMMQAGLTLDDISFFEYHDAFSIYAALSLEAVGFAIKGAGWKLASSGKIAINGKIPCATMGGMKARGFPGGAAGVYQAVEAALQLRGEAGANQVPSPRYGLIQSLGGPASTAVSHVLKRVDE